MVKGDRWLSAPPGGGLGDLPFGANYSTLLKWHLGVPLLPEDCAGRPLPLFGVRSCRVMCIQLGRSVARQLDDQLMGSTEKSAWWAPALPATSAFTAAGNQHW